MNVTIRDPIGRKIDGIVTIDYRSCILTITNSGDTTEYAVWFTDKLRINPKSIDEAMDEIERWHRVQYDLDSMS